MTYDIFAYVFCTYSCTLPGIVIVRLWGIASTTNIKNQHGVT